jgi:hypothetical protein
MREKPMKREPIIADSAGVAREGERAGGGPWPLES